MTYQATTIGVNRVRIPRLLSRIFKVGYVTLGALTLIPDQSAIVPVVVAVGSFASWGLLIASYVTSLVEWDKRGDVSVTATELVLSRYGSGPQAIPRREIVSALLVRRIHNVVLPAVEVSLRSGDRVNIKLPDAETGAQLVRELGFGADGARLRIDLAQPSRRLLHLPIAFAIYMIQTFLTLTVALLVGGYGALGIVMTVAPLLQLGLYFLAVRAFAAPTVVVGRDGVLVKRGRKKKLYRADDPDLLSTLRGVGIDETRVREAIHAAQERAAGTKPVATLFERGTLSLEEWRARIVTAMDGGYRTSGNVPDLAKAVLASAEAAPDERIGAALALRVAGDLDTVRVAGEATADENVRVVLEAVAAEADDRVVEKHLRRIR